MSHYNLINPLVASLVFGAIAAAQAEDAWIELFNGQNLDGWTERNKEGSFRVEDGAIVGTAVEGLGTTFLCTNEYFADFELEFDLR